MPSPPTIPPPEPATGPPEGHAAPPAAPPTSGEVMDLLRGVVDPELGADIVELGMAREARVSHDGAVSIVIALTIAGCPLRAQIQRDIRHRLESHPGVSSVRIDWDEMTPEERTEVMQRARKQAADTAPDTEVPATTRVLAIASGKGGVGKSSVTVNLAAALAARGLTVGVLDADIWGFSVPRMLGVAGRLGGTDGKILPSERRVGEGTLKVVSTGLLVDREETALMWRGLMLNQAVREFLQKVRWGPMDYLLIDMPPGTGDVQMGLARMLPRAEMVIVTTPAVSAQKVAVRAADMARRSYLRLAGVVENMSAFTCEHGTAYPLFGEGGGERLAAEVGTELLAQIPLEPQVAAGSDTGQPVAVDGDGPAARAFRTLAERIVTDTVPPAALEGCSARLLDRVEEALGAADG